MTTTKLKREQIIDGEKIPIVDYFYNSEADKNNATNLTPGKIIYVKETGKFYKVGDEGTGETATWLVDENKSGNIIGDFNISIGQMIQYPHNPLIDIEAETDNSILKADGRTLELTTDTAQIVDILGGQKLKDTIQRNFDFTPASIPIPDMLSPNTWYFLEGTSSTRYINRIVWDPNNNTFSRTARFKAPNSYQNFFRNSGSREPFMAFYGDYIFAHNDNDGETDSNTQWKVYKFNGSYDLDVLYTKSSSDDYLYISRARPHKEGNNLLITRYKNNTYYYWDTSSDSWVDVNTINSNILQILYYDYLETDNYLFIFRPEYDGNWRLRIYRYNFISGTKYIDNTTKTMVHDYEGYNITGKNDTTIRAFIKTNDNKIIINFNSNTTVALFELNSNGDNINLIKYVRNHELGANMTKCCNNNNIVSIGKIINWFNINNSNTLKTKYIILDDEKIIKSICDYPTNVQYWLMFVTNGDLLLRDVNDTSSTTFYQLTSDKNNDVCGKIKFTLPNLNNSSNIRSDGTDGYYYIRVK